MPFDLTVRPPRTGDGFLDLVARVIFASGLRWQTVETRWGAIREAFERFSVGKVARYGTGHVGRLMAAEGMIANRAKIEAVITAASRLEEAGATKGSVRRWLNGLDGFDERRKALCDLPYVGRWGAYYVLAVAGYPVPEDWKASG